MTTRKDHTVCIQKDDEIKTWVWYSVEVVKYKTIRVDRKGRIVDLTSSRIKLLEADEIRLLDNENKHDIIRQAKDFIRYASEQR